LLEIYDNMLYFMHKRGFFDVKIPSRDVFYAQFLLKKTLKILKKQNRYCIFCTKLAWEFLADSLYQERRRFFYTVVEEIQ
jgi:hypothetical protein